MPLPEWIKKFKEPRTEIKFINGYYYKYSVEYKYNPIKKRTDKKTKGLLGKINEKDGFIPSPKNILKEKLNNKENTILNVDIKTFGIYNLFQSLLEDDLESLLKLFPKNINESLITIALMRFAYQSPLKRIPYYHNHDFCSQKWAVNGLNDKKISEALRIIGENRNTILTWMNGRLINNISTENMKNFVMLDSTHIPSVSEHLHINNKGFNSNQYFNEQIRLMYIFSTSTKQPVYYRMIQGNITDVKSMKRCIDELEINDVIFVGDKGFYSKNNVINLKSNNIQFIIPLYRNNSLINFKPLLSANFKQKIKKYFKYEDIIIWYYEYEKNEQKFVTFLDENLKIEEEKDYLFRIQTHPDEYTEEKFYKKLHQFGTLTITYKINKDIKAQELYEVYKQRNEIEIMFDAYKNFLEADKTYMQNRYVLEGWLMANFIAMIAYYRLFSRLKNAKLLEKYSPKDIIEYSKSIFMHRTDKNWSLSEMTNKTIELFKKINIDYLISRS